MPTLKFNRAEVMKMLDTVLSDDADIQIVKDDGIYLMSFGDKPTNATPEWKRTVAYAKGYNPEKDGEEVWEKSREAMGGFLAIALMCSSMSHIAGPAMRGASSSVSLSPSRKPRATR